MSDFVGIGIDLVRSKTVREAELRLFLSARERGQAGAYDPTLLWALKEAAWKAVGGTRSTPFKAVELELDARGSLSGVRFQGVTHRAGSVILTPRPGLRAAMVWLMEAA